jgi:hypothetical protein
VKSPPFTTETQRKHRENHLFKKIFSVAFLYVSVSLWWVFDVFTAPEFGSRQTITS